MMQFTNSSRNQLGMASSNVLDGMGQNQSEMIEQLPSDYIYIEMFKAFDVEQRGVISRLDMNVAAKALGWHE